MTMNQCVSKKIECIPRVMLLLRVLADVLGWPALMGDLLSSSPLESLRLEIQWLKYYVLDPCDRMDDDTFVFVTVFFLVTWIPMTVRMVVLLPSSSLDSLWILCRRRRLDVSARCSLHVALLSAFSSLLSAQLLNCSTTRLLDYSIALLCPLLFSARRSALLAALLCSLLCSVHWSALFPALLRSLLFSLLFSACCSALVCSLHCSLLAADCWLLTADCWLLTVDCWLLTSNF